MGSLKDGLDAICRQFFWFMARSNNPVVKLSVSLKFQICIKAVYLPTLELMYQCIQIHAEIGYYCGRISSHNFCSRMVWDNKNLICYVKSKHYLPFFHVAAHMIFKIAFGNEGPATSIELAMMAINFPMYQLVHLEIARLRKSLKTPWILALKRLSPRMQVHMSSKTAQARKSAHAVIVGTSVNWRRLVQSFSQWSLHYFKLIIYCFEF